MHTFSVDLMDKSRLRSRARAHDLDLHGANDLITNLDHELSDVRLRALKCLLRKLDCGIISAESLSERIDLLNRLSAWLRIEPGTGPGEHSKRNNIHNAETSEAIPLVIELLRRLSEYEHFRRLIFSEKVDSLLIKLRLHVGGDIKSLIDRLLDEVNSSNIDIQYEGGPENWNDNTCFQPVVYTKVSPRTARFSSSEEIVVLSEDFVQESPNLTFMDVEVPPDSAENSQDVYFPNQNFSSEMQGWAKNTQFGVYTAPLGATDRRVLSSTVESLLSKNESLVFITVCFARDVLLNDFPPETLIQESSFNLGLLQVAESQWQDNKPNYVATQALLKLSSSLRFRFAQLNSSEFFQTRNNTQKQSQGYYDGSTYPSNGTSSTKDTGATDYFVRNLCQLLKSLSRSILFNCEAITLWILMDSFAFTLLKCVSIFPVDSKTLAMSLQEILLDLAHCYDKHADTISTQALALVMSSILNSLYINQETFIVAKDVRRAIRCIACCPRLVHQWPQVHAHYLKFALPFDSTLEQVNSHIEIVCEGLKEISNVLKIEHDVDMTPETFSSIKKAIPQLNYIEQESCIDIFMERTFSLFTNPAYNNLLPKSEERVSVILQLMAHISDDVRKKIYSVMKGLAKKHFGPEKISRNANTSHEEIALSILLNRGFIKEVLNFGLKDSVAETQHYAEEIILFLMKCKTVVNSDLWGKVLSCLSSFLNILETQADPQTVLGKAVLNFCDPSSNEIDLSDFQLLCSNLRLLYSCNLRVREEASDRLMKILSATETGSITFRYASYSNYTLTNIFSVGRNLEMDELDSGISSDVAPETGNLLRQLEICRADDLEAVVRRNALVQLSLMMVDSRHHATFIQQNGLELVVDIISKIASEKDYKFSLDMWPPSVHILKLISMYKGRSRKILMEDYDLLVNLSCGLFSLRSDDRFRLDAVHLLSLLLFHSSLKLSEDGKKCFFPQVILNRYRIPIVAEPYLKISSHTPTAPNGLDGENNNSTNDQINLKKYPLENIFKSWWKMDGENETIIEQVGNDNRNSKKPPANLKNKLKPDKVVVNLLIGVQNASGHKAVVESIDHLWDYVLPLVLNTRSGNNIMDHICTPAPWRDTFYRFLSVEPTCPEDEELLIKVLDLLTFLLTHLKEAVPLTSWVVPLCMEKSCAGLRLLAEHSFRKESPYSGTMVPAILRSLFDFYNILVIKHETAIVENVWEFFNSLCHILHGIAEENFKSSAILQPTLHGLAVVITMEEIADRLLKNTQLTLAVVHRVIEAIVSAQERGGGSGDSYRNRGTLYYASLSLLHFIQILNKEKKDASLEWSRKCVSVLPVLWNCDDPRIRAAGFQICQIFTSTTKGASMLISCLETPDILWIAAYNALMDHEEMSVVKHKAANVLLNILSLWNDILETGLVTKHLSLPRWPVIENYTTLVSNICWHSQLSTIFRRSELADSIRKEDNDLNQMITPKVLSVVCKLMVAMSSSNVEIFHPDSFLPDISSFGLCPLLFRIIGSHNLSLDMEESWWVESCSALSDVVEALNCLAQMDRTISVILIGDKRNLNHLVQLFLLQPPSGKFKDKAMEVLSSLWVNIFTLLSTLCSDAGNNFEDLERNIWSQKNTIFLRLVDWLRSGALVKCRKVALNFTCGFLSMLSLKQQEKDNQNQLKHPILCLEWKENQSYGVALCKSLINILEDAINAEERILILNAFGALFCLSGSAKQHAIDDEIVQVLVEKLKVFGLQYFEVGESQAGKKSAVQWCDETVWILTVLSTLLYGSLEAKQAALCSCIADTIHKILKCGVANTDRSLLYSFIETLLNFTEEFPLGAQSMTVTTSLVGVGPRKVPTPQSIMVEFLNLLQSEIDLVEKNPNLKTIDLLLALLKNAVFVVECRNVVAKSGILSFIRKLHVREMKKWGPKQQHVKIQFLAFVVHLTVHPDMQIVFTKVPESVEILILLIDAEPPPVSSMALKILRNLAFNPGNRARFLCDNGPMPALSEKLRTSEDLEELQSAAVGLWALLANSEKGKLLAKKSSCLNSISRALAKVRKLEQCSNDLSSEKRDLSSLINLLGTVSNLLGGPGPTASNVSS